MTLKITAKDVRASWESLEVEMHMQETVNAFERTVLLALDRDCWLTAAEVRNRAWPGRHKPAIDQVAEVLEAAAATGRCVRADTKRHGKGRIAYLGLRMCRVCCCTERHACLDGNGEPCSWIGRDRCSECRGLTEPE